MRRSKFLTYLLLLTLLFTQVLSLASTGSVYANESSKNYLDIVPGKILVKYKDEESPYMIGLQKEIFKVNNSFTISEVELPETYDVFNAINEYENDPNVEYAEPVYIFRADENSNVSITQSVYNPNDEYYQWGEQKEGFDPIDIIGAWEKINYDARENITIAVIDTAIDLEHEDLIGNFVDGYDFIADMPINSNYENRVDNVHGTHVAGIAAAISDNEIGLAGVAGGVKIMPLRVLDENGESSGTEVIDAIKWAADHGADVINLSLSKYRYLRDENGYFIKDENGELIDTKSQAEEEVISYAINKGVVIISATGNLSNHWIEGDIGDHDYVDGQELYYNHVGYPAAYSGVIGVGAVDTKASTEPIIADFSNIGYEVDVVAPGVDIFGTVPTNDYVVKSGTSMSTPFVSGLAALILAANPDLSPFEVNNILYETSVDLGDEDWDEYFGYGLINGRSAFETPRLDIDVEIDDEITVSDTVYYNITTKDYEGQISSENGEAIFYFDRFNFNEESWESLEDTTIEVVYGQSEGILSLPDIGWYCIYANENDDNNWVWSSSEFIVYRPKAPTTNLSSGSYSDTQSVVLTTETQGAKIYYTTNGDEPTSNSKEYVNPISISKSTTIKAITIKNHIKSEISTFSYKISSGNTGGGGGGGGGGSTSKKVTVVEVSEEKIKEIKESKKTTVVIEVESKSEEDKDFSVELPSDVLKLAKDNNKTIKIKSKNVAINIEPGLLEIKDEKATIKLTVKALKDSKSDLDKKDKYADGVSEVFDFELDVNDTKISKFEKPVQITVTFDRSKVKDVNKLGVYYFNEKADNWEYVGGSVNEDGAITFETEHFSKYTVMEYNKSFSDINNHWAKYDIEVMASKHIANGIDDKNFAPNKNITRAEFASLLTRALNLPSANTKDSFTDIDNAWYSDAVKRAYSAKIINGIDDTNFAPNKNITREQMASMLMRAYSYASGKNLNDLYTTTEVKFNDEGTVSKWARMNVRLAASLKLINGKPDGKFVPNDTATRAEAISVIKRLLEKIDN